MTGERSEPHRVRRSRCRLDPVALRDQRSRCRPDPVALLLLERRTSSSARPRERAA